MSSDSNTFLPTTRLAAALGPKPWLTIAASGFTGVRLPTILELFGNRAFIRGYPQLQPERGVGGDLSFVMAGRRRLLKGSAEARGFYSARDDIIVALRSNEQLTFRNLGHAKSWGAEGRFAGEISPHLTFTSTLTWLFTRDQDGNQLPALTPFNTLTRLEGHTRAFGSVVDDLVLFAQFYYRAGGFSAPSENAARFPEYKPLTIGAYALLFEERLWVAFTARNVNNNRSFDIIGYPLPGINYAFEISYRHRFTGR